MKDQRKTKKQLIGELEALRERVAELESPFDRSAAAATPTFNRALYTVTSDPVMNVEQKTQHLLGVVCRQLGVEVGLLAKVSGDRLEIIQAHTDDESIRPGKVYPLRETFCALTFAEDQPVSFVGATGSDWADHPAYAVWGFESYIGTHVRVGDELFGTLSFASRGRRANAFARAELTNVKLMAQWIGHELMKARVEEALRESEHKYRTVVEAAGDAILMTDLDGRPLVRNAAFYASLGYRSDDDPELDWWSLIHPDDRAKLRDRLATIVGTGGGTAEYRIRHKDGHWVYRHARSTLTYDEANRPEAVLTIVRDITDRKEVEEALRESERRYAVAEEVARFGHWEWEFASNTVVRSREYCRIFGVDPTVSRPTTERFREAIHPEDRDRVDRELSDMVAARERRREMEFRVQRDDGTIRAINSVVELRFAPSGEPTGMVGTAYDITERKRAAEALQESEDRFEDLYDHAPDMYFTVAEDGTVLSVNQFGAHWLGYEKDDLIGGPVWTVVHPDDRERIQKQVVEIFRHRPEHTELEFRKVRRDGSVLWVHERVRIPPQHPDAPSQMWIVCRDVTERKQAEDAMKHRNMELESIFQALPDLYFRLARDGTILDYRANPKLELYLPPGHFIHKRIGDVLPQEVGQLFEDGLAEVLTSGAHAMLEYSLPMPSGRRQYEARLVRLSIDEVVTIVRDITERKRAETELIASEERYRAVSEITSNYSFGFRVSAHGELVREWVAGDYVGITGFTIEEVEARGGWRTIVHPDDIPFLEGAVNEILGNGGQTSATVRVIRKDGEIRWLRVYGKVVQGEKDEPTRIYGAAQDITKQKRESDARRASEARLRLLTDQLPALVWTTDLELQISSCVGSLAEQLGGTPETQTQTVADFLDTDDANTPPIRAHRRALDGESVSFEHSLRGREYEVHVEPFTSPNGRVIGVIGVALDVTARKHDERERRRLETQLRQAQKMDALGMLAGGIAHDFNNILLAIMGYAEIVESQVPEESEAARNVDKLLTAAERADALVNQILAFSRKSDQAAKPIRVHDTVQDGLNLLRATIPTTILFRERIGLEGATILGDPSQIHQVMLNLGSNAAHAMRLSGGVLDVTLDRVEIDDPPPDTIEPVVPGVYARLTVKDTGAGMDDETRSKIFDPFFTTKEVGEGTGLGLAVVHGIVVACGGFVRVDSALGEGTTFEVFLPIVGEAADAPREPSQAAEGGVERVLFIDDEEHVTEIGRQQLETLGYTVTAVTDSREAWELFESHPDAFDVIVTDQTMPHLTGLEFTERARSLRPDVPILLTTGYSDQVTEESVARAGLDIVLKKPYRRDVLGRAVKRVIKKG